MNTETLKDFFSWWLWRRWRIYCPKHSVTNLFERLSFKHSLFDPTEAFLSPCSMNEINCGKLWGDWTPTVKFMPAMVMREENH